MGRNQKVLLSDPRVISFSGLRFNGMSTTTSLKEPCRQGRCLRLELRTSQLVKSYEINARYQVLQPGGRRASRVTILSQSTKGDGNRRICLVLDLPDCAAGGRQGKPRGGMNKEKLLMLVAANHSEHS